MELMKRDRGMEMEMEVAPPGVPGSLEWLAKEIIGVEKLRDWLEKRGWTRANLTFPNLRVELEVGGVEDVGVREQGGKEE